MNKIKDVKFLLLTSEQNKEFQKALLTAIEKINMAFDAPYTVKERLMKTDIKMANNVLNTAGKLRSAESGMMQGMAVIAERRGKSKIFQEYIDFNLPHLKPIKKLNK